MIREAQREPDAATPVYPGGIGDWPRHVCLCRDRLEGPGAGAERVFIEQVATLVERGIHCSLVFFHLGDFLRKQLPQEANTIVLGDSRYGELVFLPKLLRLSILIRKLRPDCVIAHQSLADYLRWALIGTDIPYFLLKYTSPFNSARDTTKYSVLHRDSFHKVRSSLTAYTEGVPVHWQAGLHRRVANELYAARDRFGVRGAKGVFTLTSQSQWELQQLYGIQPIVWTPGLRQAGCIQPRDDEAIRDLRNRYHLQDGERVILSVNRLEYRKRIDLLIEGFHLLRIRGLPCKLVIVGDGEEREALGQQVQAKGLSDSVIFAGRIHEDLLARHYYMCDTAVAIIWGTWALSVVEPLLYNRKVIISSEIPDLLADVPNVFRVKPEAFAVAQGLEEALNSPTSNSYDVIKDKLDWHGQMNELLCNMRRLARAGPLQQIAASDPKNEGTYSKHS